MYQGLKNGVCHGHGYAAAPWSLVRPTSSGGRSVPITLRQMR
jgi:hypothetical protein